MGFDFSYVDSSILFNCFLHFNLDDFKDGRQMAADEDDISQFTRQDCDGSTVTGTSSTELPCDDFAEAVGKFSYRGSRQDGISTIPDCKEACREVSVNF